MTAGNRVEESVGDHVSPSGPVDILCVDDETDFLNLTKRYLEVNDSPFEIQTETSPRDALAQIRDRGWGAVVSDYRMPTMNGLELLAQLRTTHPTLPFVLITSERDPAIEAEVIQDPYADFTLKRGGLSFGTVLQFRVGQLLSLTNSGPPE